MISYGDAVQWCVRNGAVFRFVNRRERPSFIIVNEGTPGDKSLELAVEVEGKTRAAHYPLDSTLEPSKAVALALIACVEFFASRPANNLSLN